MEHNFQERIAKLQQYLKQASLDAFIVSSQDSIYYLAGASYMPLERPFFIIVRPEGFPDLVVPQLEYEHMRKVKGFGEIKSYFEYPSIEGSNWYDRLHELLGDGARVGVEPSLSIAKVSLLHFANPIIDSVIDKIRMVKTPDEIDAIRLAAKWTNEGMFQLHHGLYKGQTVIETSMPAKKLQTGVIASGEFDFLNSSFLTIGWPAPKSAQPHSVPDLHTPMGKGPVVLMSFNRVNGYAAECERTVFLEKPSEDERRYFSYMMEARALAYSMVKPGVRCHDIDVATQKYFGSVRCGNRIIHRTGHGIGLGNHEQPWLSAGSEDVLEENMVISIEPAVYFPEIGGFRHSDTVLVTKTGYEVITSYPDDLESLIIHESGWMKKIKGRIIRKAIHY